MSSCSRASSTMYSGGSRSGRVESTCPSFAKVGPSSSSASRRRRARSAGGRSSRRPWRAKHPADLDRAAEQALARLVGRDGPRPGCDEDHAAAGSVRDAVGDVGEQELRAIAHAGVRQDDQVDAAIARLTHDGAGWIGVGRVERDDVELGPETIRSLARPRHRATARLGHGEDLVDGHRRDSARSRRYGARTSRRDRHRRPMTTSAQTRTIGA